MRREWYGAIDQGTTSTRFIVFDLATNPPAEIIQASRRVHTEAPHPGWAQQDPIQMLDALKECIQEAAEKIKTKFGYAFLKDCVNCIQFKVLYD
jgi:glycerol kinase